MHEPLKNKRKTVFGEKIKIGEDEGIIFWNLSFTELDCFLYDDVRSAVEGLKNDIREVSCYRECVDDTVVCVDDVFELIDKWFGDVLE